MPRFIINTHVLDNDNTSESDYTLYIQEADYIFKGPIIYS